MSRPNIIFILMDDLGWKDLGCYGSEFYETENLDRLAQEGMKFSDAYATCPVCSPSRASVMTGKYPARVGVTNWISHSEEGNRSRGKLIDALYTKHLPLEETSLATTLKKNGYRTWHVGKWHLGQEPYWPDKHGFDVNIGGCEMGHPQHGYFSPWKIPALAEGKEGEYLPDHLTDRAIELINENSDEPFFLNMWYYLVHTPIQAKPELEEYFTEKAKKMGLDKIDPLVEGELYPAGHKKDLHVMRRVIQSNPAYAAMVKSMDENIGRLLAALEESGKAENTIIVFTSDNGGLSTSETSPTCNAPLCEGKGWMYEGGTREPLIVRWPGKVRPGAKCDTPVTGTDFYPTLLEAVGLPLMPEQHVDGESIMPLLTESGELDRKSIFWHYPHYGNQGGTPGSSVRSGDYKLIEFFEDNRVELYNLREDISEENDLAEEMPEKRDELRKRLHEWQDEVCAKIPEKNPDFTPWRPEGSSPKAPNS